MRALHLVFFGVVVAVMAMGCGTRGDRPSDGGTFDTMDPPVAGCDASVDSDGDGIADAIDGNDDTDGDGTPDRLDDDSDGDGISDAEEHAGFGPCNIADADMDGIPNHQDTDSDNDGLSDADETNVYYTDPHNRDSDGDGVTDLGEVAAMTDPNDASSTISDDDFFVVLPYLGDHVTKTLRFGTEIQRADIYFLIDTTGSMGPSIDNVRSSLSRIATALAGEIPDVQMGVGHFEDFPFASGSPFGDTFFGGPADVAYGNEQDITGDVAAVQSALDGLVIGDGHDGPEAQVQALYQTATGAGGDWNFMGSAASWSLPRRDCFAVPDEVGRRRGYPCFRPGSLPVVVLVTDIEWHNGYATGDHWPYSQISPAPQGLPDAAMALNAIGGRYVGVVVDSGGGSWPMDHEQVAMMTGSVDGTGAPLVYDAVAGSVSDRIIDGIRTLVGSTPQNVTTVTENVPPNPDGVDATGFIISITPLEGYGPGGIAGAGYDSKDDVAFYGVTPGTVVEFEVDFYNDFVTPPPTAQVYKANIVVMGNGVARLSERNVYIIVPPEGGTVLI